MTATLKCFISFLFLLHISSCAEKKEATPTPIIDKTWAKNIEGGKEYVFTYGFKNYSVQDGLTIKVEVDSYQAKTITFKPICNRLKIEELFKTLSNDFPTYKFQGILLSIGYKEPSEYSFKRFGSIIVTNAKNGSLSRPSININDLPEFFTFRNLPDSNTGIIPNETLRTDKSTVYEIRGIVFVGIDPNILQMGEYLIQFNPDI